MSDMLLHRENGCPAENCINDGVRFLTVNEFASRIGVHPQTVRMWDKKGMLKPHHKTPSGRRLYSEEQVSDYFGKN